MCHWFYYEQIELLISVFIYKGIWDFLETAVNGYLEGVVEDPDEVSLLISFVIGYALYFIILLYQYLLNKFQISCLKVNFTRELVFFVTFFSIVATWRAIWDAFDFYFYNSDYRDYIIFSSHFGIFVLLFFMQLQSFLYTGGSCLPDVGEIDYKIGVKEFIAKHSEIKFFTIE